MIEPAIPQEPEDLRPRAIWWVGIGVIALGVVLAAIAWWLVVPPSPGERAAEASPLEHGPIDRASGGADVRAAGEQRLERIEWVDREAGTVRIPIDRAIDAVVADPALIGTARSAASGATRGPLPAATPDAVPGEVVR